MLAKKTVVTALFALGIGAFLMMGYDCDDATPTCQYHGWGNAVPGSCATSGALVCFNCESRPGGQMACIE
jgi:hypothetical protein